jgi:hypothetical protein
MKTAYARFGGTGRIVVDDCPYCHRTHYHNQPVGEGRREADCFRGEYILSFDEPATLPPAEEGNDDNIMACILFAKSQGLAVAGDAATDYAQLRAAVGRLEGERDEWRRALQSLTPGGSEFTEPHECANYVRTRDAERWELLKRMKRERDTLAAALAADGERGTEENDDEIS